MRDSPLITYSMNAVAIFKTYSTTPIFHVSIYDFLFVTNGWTGGQIVMLGSVDIGVDICVSPLSINVVYKLSLWASRKSSHNYIISLIKSHNDGGAHIKCVNNATF